MICCRFFRSRLIRVRLPRRLGRRERAQDNSIALLVSGRLVLIAVVGTRRQAVLRDDERRVRRSGKHLRRQHLFSVGELRRDDEASPAAAAAESLSLVDVAVQHAAFGRAKDGRRRQVEIGKLPEI